MIGNPSALKEFEDRFSRAEGRLDARRAFTLVDAMWREGVALGVLPPRDPLEGIETDIRLASILNSCSRKSSPS